MPGPPLNPRVRGLAAAALASASTWSMQHLLGLNAVAASASVGLLGGVALPDAAWRLPFFCGTFVGMSSKAVVGSCAQATIVGGVAGAVVMPMIATRVVGRGGRLGYASICAVVASWVVELLLRPARCALTGVRIVGPLPWSLLMEHPLATLAGPLLGALATKACIEAAARADDKAALADRLGNSVTASSLAGALACLGPPAWAAPVYMGSFVAMSAPAVLPSWRDVTGAAAAAALLHVLLGGVLAGGFGGRLGLSAMLGVLAYGRLRWA